MQSPQQPPGNFFLGLARDWGVGLIVVLGIFLLWQSLFSASAPALGPAPDFTLSDLAGDPVQLSQAGDVVVLNFWFTTCPPCRAEIPELTRFQEENPDVPLLGISTDRMPTALLERKSKELGIGYRVLHDTGLDVTREYGVTVFPTTLVIKDGVIVQTKVGALNREILTAMVDQAR